MAKLKVLEPERHNHGASTIDQVPDRSSCQYAGIFDQPMVQKPRSVVTG